MTASAFPLARPSHKRDDECAQCLEIRPLLMPVAIDSIGGPLVWFLCRDCRLNWQDGEWRCLATTSAHRRRRSNGDIAPRANQAIAEARREMG